MDSPSSCVFFSDVNATLNYSDDGNRYLVDLEKKMACSLKLYIVNPMIMKSLKLYIVD